MSHNWTNLVAQGRAKGNGQPWSNEELEFLILLEKERHLARVTAADYIRNGIKTLEDYDEAKKADFVPLNIEEAQTEADRLLAERGKKAIEEATMAMGTKEEKEVLKKKLDELGIEYDGRSSVKTLQDLLDTAIALPEASTEPTPELPEDEHNEQT